MPSLIAFSIKKKTILPPVKIDVKGELWQYKISYLVMVGYIDNSI